MLIPTWSGVQDHLSAMQWNVLKHPAYNLDSSPDDFHTFGPLKIPLEGCPLTKNNNVQGAVSMMV
jgi:hypothetical protein